MKRALQFQFIFYVLCIFDKKIMSSLYTIYTIRNFWNWSIVNDRWRLATVVVHNYNLCYSCITAPCSVYYIIMRILYLFSYLIYCWLWNSYCLWASSLKFLPRNFRWMFLVASFAFVISALGYTYYRTYVIGFFRSFHKCQIWQINNFQTN